MPAGEWKFDLQDLDDIDLDASDFNSSLPLKKVPNGDIFEASRAGDVDRLRYLLELGVNVNARDRWDSVALYYACLSGHLDAARMLLESGAICSEHTFDGDRCHYAALNLKVRKLLKAYEARPPPLAPLQASLRDSFLSCSSNASAYAPPLGLNHVPSDVIFYVQGKPIEAHRVILCARSKFFKKKFEKEWKERREVRFGSGNLSYAALHSLIHFFYSDRLEIPLDAMEDLLRICKVCRCDSLYSILEKELFHQRYAEYKSVKNVEASQKRFILHGASLPADDRLPASLRNLLEEGFADFRVKIGESIYELHRVVVASRSEYFRARLTHSSNFNNDNPCIEEHDLSTEVFEKMVEYMYTDTIAEINYETAEEIFDASSRYLLFPLKRAAGELLMPYIETVSPSELCHWLVLSEFYGVGKIREFCLHKIANDFETFVDTLEFRVFLLSLPPPSGDSSLRTTLPSFPGADSFSDQANLLDDLREKWLQAEGAELDKRDESALLFDKRLETLMVDAEKEFSSTGGGGSQ